MTQSSTSRNTRTSGLRRPALALAFGTAAVASALAPVASMAVTTVTPSTNKFNDIMSDGTKKPVGNAPLPAVVKFGGTTASAQTKLTKLLPATAVPAPTTSLATIRGVVYSQAIAGSNGAKRNNLNTTYTAWKKVAAPAVTAWLNYKKTPTSAKLNAYTNAVKIYNTAKGPTKWTAYSNAYNQWLTVYKAQLALAQANHFQLAAKTAFAGRCTSADNRQASFFGANSAVVNAPGTLNAATGEGYAIWCNTGTGTLNYYLPENGNGSGFETFTETITTDPVTGAVTDVGTVTDAIGDSLNIYINGDFFMNADGVKVAVQGAPLVATKRSDINGFATKAIIAGGYLLSGQTCISAAAGATLTCQAFTQSLQNALNAAYVVSPK